MKNRKPFKGRIRKMAEGADLTEGADETGTFESGVKLGRNVNISDDTRSRAMAMIERLNKGKDIESAPAPKAAPRAAPKLAPRAAPKLAPKAMTDTGDGSERKAAAPASARSSAPDSSLRYPPARSSASESAPARESARAGTLEDPEYRKKLEKGQALERVYPESVAGAGALGAVNRLARAAAQASTRRASTQGLSTLKELPGPAARKALPAPAEGAAARSVSPKALSGPAKALPAPEKGGRLNSIMEAARKRAAAMREARQNPQRTPPRDVDEARMAGEGPGFRKGGSVRGCGIARKGLTKGKMR
jgi:hypothetical protein